MMCQHIEGVAKCQHCHPVPALAWIVEAAHRAVLIAEVSGIGSIRAVRAAESIIAQAKERYNSGVGLGLTHPIIGEKS